MLGDVSVSRGGGIGAGAGAGARGVGRAMRESEHEDQLQALRLWQQAPESTAKREDQHNACNLQERNDKG